MKTSPLFFQRLLQAAGRAAGRAVGWAQQGDVPWTWVLLALAAVSPRRSLRLALGAAKATVPLALATAAASAVSEGFRRALYFHARVVPLIASYRLVDLATRRKAADVRAAVLRGAETPDFFSTRPSAELQAILRDIFKTRTSKQWLAFSDEANTPIAPVNTPQNIVDDAQFQARFKLLPHEQHGADMLGFPVHFVGEELPLPGRAPTVGQHSEQVLRELLGFDQEKIAALRQAGVLG